MKPNQSPHSFNLGDRVKLNSLGIALYGPCEGTIVEIKPFKLSKYHNESMHVFLDNGTHWGLNEIELI